MELWSVDSGHELLRHELLRELANTLETNRSEIGKDSTCYGRQARPTRVFGDWNPMERSSSLVKAARQRQVTVASGEVKEVGGMSWGQSSTRSLAEER